MVSWNRGWEVKSLRDATLLASPSREGALSLFFPSQLRGSFWELVVDGWVRSVAYVDGEERAISL